MIKVSVIIPMLNSDKTIETCFRSILTQTLDEIEIICIDDGSTDETLMVMKKMAGKDGRIRTIQIKHSGTGSARNTGIDNAEGEYLAFMDSDDEYPNTRVLEELYTKAVLNDADVCGGSWNITDPSIDDYEDMVFSKEGFVDFCSYQYDYGFQRFIYHRKLFSDASIRFPHYSVYEDPVFFIRIMMYAGKFYAISSCTYSYNPTSHSINSKEKLLDYLCALSECLMMTNRGGFARLHSIQFRRLIKTGCKYGRSLLDHSELEEQIRRISININTDYLNQFGYDPSELIDAIGGSMNSKKGLNVAWN